MLYKYFTWTDDEGYYCGNQLITHTQVRQLLKNARSNSDVFATIQDYDVDGNCIGCPMYFDIDSPSLLDAYNDMRGLCDSLEEEGYRFNVFFSGSKGFHVVCDRYIRHPRCHEIMRMIADEYTQYDIDTNVYTTRRMWRCNNTVNQKSGRKKYLVSRDDTIDNIINGKSQAEYLYDISDLDIDGYVEELPDLTQVMQQMGVDFEENMMPCMRTIWSMKEPPEGSRHQMAHLFARHCFRSDLSLEQALEFFNTHEFWKDVRRSEGHSPE